MRFVRQSRISTLGAAVAKKERERRVWRANSFKGVSGHNSEDDEKIQLCEEDARKTRDKLRGALPLRHTVRMAFLGNLLSRSSVSSLTCAETVREKKRSM